MICVAQNLRQKRKIKAIPSFTHLRGHYMDDQFGQELCRGTIALFITCLEDVLQTSEGKQIALIMYRSMKQGITADYLKRLAKLFKEYEVIIVPEEN